jgi:hypothetical protein
MDDEKWYIMHSLNREKDIIYQGTEQECKKKLMEMQMQNPEEASKYICSNHINKKESGDNFEQLLF